MLKYYMTNYHSSPSECKHTFFIATLVLLCKNFTMRWSWINWVFSRLHIEQSVIFLTLPSNLSINLDFTCLNTDCSNRDIPVDINVTVHHIVKRCLLNLSSLLKCKDPVINTSNVASILEVFSHYFDIIEVI